MSGLIKKAVNWATPLFAVIGIVALVFFISFIVIWGFTTGIALFLFCAILLIVLQAMGAVKLWQNPWLILLPPLLILVGYARTILQRPLHNTTNQTTSATGTIQLTLANSTVFTILIVVAAIIIGLILGYALKREMKSCIYHHSL